MAVEQLEVVSPIRPSTTAGDEVIDCHPSALRKEQATLQALALWSLQESCDPGRDVRMLPKAGTPIHPIAIVGAAHAVDLSMPTNRRLPMTVQAQLPKGRLKEPAVACGKAPVPMSDPPFALVGVAVGRPGAQHPIEPVVQTLKDVRAPDPGVVVCPSHDDRIKQSD